MPIPALNSFLALGRGKANEPRNAGLVTALLAVATVAGASIDSVARLVSMFFMVTYGALCAISFLEHLAARPKRPPELSLEVVREPARRGPLPPAAMFQMDPGYALLAILVMSGLYVGLRAMRGGEGDLAELFRA